MVCLRPAVLQYRNLWVCGSRMLHARSIVHLAQVSLHPVWLEPSCLGSTVDPARVSLGHVVLQYRNLWVCG